LEKSSSTRAWRQPAPSTDGSAQREKPRAQGIHHPAVRHSAVISALVFLGIFGVIFIVIWVAHFPLLRLPYFWDEAGYFVPAARDILLSGSLIPHSTLSNAHPPLVTLYLAGCWKIFGFSPIVTRTAMLLVAAFALLGVFRLAEFVANREVAIGATLCTALYPVFFAQSSLAHLDVAAAAFTFWGLTAYLRDRRLAVAGWFSAAVLAKETAIVAPLALVIWEIICPYISRHRENTLCICAERGGRRILNTGNFTSKISASRILALLFAIMPLGLWFAYHYWRSGYLFGNPEFFRYNVQDTMHPLRILLAGFFRLWQVFGYMNLFLLTAAAALALMYPAQATELGERKRIAIPVQAVFAVVVLAYVAVMAMIGGAVLARYMLPVVPLVIIVCVSTLWRRIRPWRTVLGIVVAGFVLALFVNPPYGFAPEDNLAYRDYVLLHQAAAEFVSTHYKDGIVLTAWPASDELTKPYLGYLQRPERVISISDFSLPQIMEASAERNQFDAALLFSTKYEPAARVLGDWPAWDRIKARFFAYHRDLPPEAVAELLGGRISYQQRRGGQWIAVLDIQPLVEAHLH
jgi:hypothetical protein